MGRRQMRLTIQFASIAALAGAAIVLAFSSNAALADKRVALVVGNSNYQNVAKLPNPSSDASAIAQMFRNAGFDVVDLQLDAGNLEFKRAIRRFEDAASGSDMAVAFFAGHGLELKGNNYMIPVDARLADERDAPDEAIALDRIVEAVDGAKRLRLVIVDACRDNPFAVTMKRQAVSRALTRGLGRVEPQGTDTLIAYAAKAGSTAEDGHGEHSPLTTALLNNLTVPGLDIRLAFGRVRDEVMKITNNRQEPFVYGSLGGGVVSLVPAPSESKEAPIADVKGDYELVKEIGTRKAWEIFLNQHKTGFYAELAAAQLAKLTAGDQGAKVAALEPTAPPSPAPALPSSDEQRAWDRIRDSGDQAALQEFIKRYPKSPLSLNAQRRLETLQQIAREREEKARAEREAAQQRLEEERRTKAAEAERQKAEQLAAAQHAEEERRAKTAEAERQKAEQQKAEQQKAAQQTPANPNDEHVTPEPNPKDVASLEPPRPPSPAKPSSAEARAWDRIKESDDRTALQDFIKRYPTSPLVLNAQKRLETLQQVAQEREEKARADRAAAQQRAEDERRAKAGEAERQKAEKLATLQRAEDERRAKAAEAERQKAEQQAALQQAEEDRRAKAAEAERQKAEQKAQQTAEKPAVPVVASNTSELIHAAQIELSRLGCFAGKADGTLNAATKAGINRYLSRRGNPDPDVAVTDSFVSELRDQQLKNCQLDCPSGQTAAGDVCIAGKKSSEPTKSARQHDDVQEKPKANRQPAKQEIKQADKKPERPSAQPQVHQEVSSTPSHGGGTMIGVGF
jgi:Caspase domain